MYTEAEVVNRLIGQFLVREESLADHLSFRSDRPGEVSRENGVGNRESENELRETSERMYG